MSEIVRVIEVTTIYTGLPEGHTEADIEQAVGALIHKAKTEYGSTFSVPLTVRRCAQKSRLFTRGGFTARYEQVYDTEAGKLVTRVDMLLPTVTEPA